MQHARRPTLLLAAALVALTTAATACGDDTDPVTPEPDLAFLVGDWNAIRFEVTPDAAPDQSLDLIAEGGTFAINIQPSGQYTAQLTLGALPGPPEIGFVEVDGNELILRRTNPPPETITRAAYTELAAGRVVFSGPSQFDYDSDGDLDPITVEVEIVRES